MFSVGILYSAQELLRLVKNLQIKVTEFPEKHSNFHVAPSKYVFETSMNCRWITSSYDAIVITHKGEEVIQKATAPERLRVQLEHLIDILKPTWSALLCYGRGEAKQFLPPDVSQCFKEAELLDSNDDDIVMWWDRLAAVLRGLQIDTKTEIGRIGEKLSLEYEEKRTGQIPYWQAIESNLAGYDILSRLCSRNDAPLKIEVKACYTEGAYSDFFVTRNEWNTAINSSNYVFHIWKLNPIPKLYVLSKEEIAPHTPEDKGNGVWQNLKITIPIN